MYLIDRDELLKRLIIDSRIGGVVTINAIMSCPEVAPDTIISKETKNKMDEIALEKAENVKNWQKTPISDAEKRLTEVVRYDND